jgi:integrase
MPFNFKKIPSKEEIVRFYNSLETVRDKTLFLILASSGKRLNEILSLKLDDIDFKQRMIKPLNTYSRTKKIWYSFYNEETEQILIEYLNKHQPTEYLIPMQKRNVNKRFAKASEKSGVKINPKDLRDIFCVLMGDLAVPDRFIDAFCGRVPKSILARHYTDYSPERLKRIYDKAELKVLS